MTYIKILTALTALALLTACGSPTVNIGEVNINNGALCDTNPYGANCGEEFETPRQTIASGCRTDDSGALCDDATTFVCDKNFDDMLCDDIKEYVDQREVVMEQCTDTKTQKACDEEDRITACDANEFATDCAEQKYVDKRRMTCTGDKTSTRCMPTVDLICGEDGDIFDDFCTGLPDTDTMRANACQTHGTDAGGDDSCAASLASSCTITDPFMYAGCDDVAGINAGVRKIFCETPANAWNPKCMETTHGTVSATRMTACEMFGTDTGTGGDDSCATSLISVCLIANPFIHEGCDDVVGIDDGVRTMFCEMPANAWNPKCMETTHGTVDATRMTACEMFGTDTGMGGDDSCANSLASSCTIANPFIHEGCDDVTGINAGVRKIFCETPATAWNPKCMDTTHGAVDATRVTACEMFGTDTGMGGDDSCATSLISVCLIANPFIHEGCDDVAGIDAGVRTMFCEMPANAWNPKCMQTTHGAVNTTRVTACQMFGTDTGTGGHTSCATSLAGVCLIANPFIHEGCDDVTDIDSGVRTMFCEMPANAWNPKCMETTHGTVSATRMTACQMFGTDTDMGGDTSCATSLISVCLIANPFIHAGCDDVTDIDSGVRTMYCEMPANAWNPKCMETTHGTVIATRMTACQMFGTGTGGHATCAASLASVCNDIANPFIHAGCDDVAGIDAGVRTMYCQMSANAWNPKCMDTTHGTVTATRGDACLEFGIDTTRGGHRSCVGNTLAESSCASNPFDSANPGCAILTKFEMIVRTYCKASHVTGCPTATYDAWVASFPDNAPLLASNLAPTAGNKFLQGKETGLNTTGLRDFTADSFNFQTATYNGMLFGGNATEGVAFQYGNIGGKRYFYAGLLSGTDLGPPLTTVTNATWYGRIVVLQNRAWYLTPAGKIYGDIDLTVNYDGDNNGTIGGVYGEYTVNGTFDSKGIMGGNVTRSKIDTYTRRTFIGDSNATTTTTYSFQRRVVGPLTGLIGQTEAVGVFIGQDFTNYDDRPRQLDANLNNFKHPATRAGFAGGFIARSTRP